CSDGISASGRPTHRCPYRPSPAPGSANSTPTASHSAGRSSSCSRLLRPAPSRPPSSPRRNGSSPRSLPKHLLQIFRDLVGLAQIGRDQPGAAGPVEDEDRVRVHHLVGRPRVTLKATR